MTGTTSVRRESVASTLSSTHRSWAFRIRPSRAASLALLLLALPAVVMFAAGVAANGAGAVAAVVVLACPGALVVLAVAVGRTSAFISCSPDCVVVGFAPVARTRLRPTEVAEVALVFVDAFAEYGGWGIKGSVRQHRGRLYSAGGSHGVRLRTHDGLTYVVAFVDRVEAEHARQAVARVLGRT